MIIIYHACSLSCISVVLNKGEIKLEAIQAEVISLFMAVILACLGVVTNKVLGYFNKKGVLVQIENNKALVQIVVKAIEQTYNHLEGEEKFKVAKLELIKLLNDKKIKISEREVDLLIESSIKEVNNSIKEVMKK